MNEIQHTMWTEEEINEGLRVLPAKIARAATEEVEAEASMKKTKHILELQQASAIIDARLEGLKDNITATELKALAYQKTAKTREVLIEDEKTYELKRIERERLQDTFNSIRKSATVNMETMKSMGGTVGRNVEKR